MSDWKFLNEHRVQRGLFASTPAAGFNGSFSFPVAGTPHRVVCIASDGMGWQHVSVSMPTASGKVPRWEVMCRVKDLFWEPEDWVVQFHPAQSQYVNNHAGVLHLWRSTAAEQPTPPSILTGIKEAGEIKSSEQARELHRQAHVLAQSALARLEAPR